MMREEDEKKTMEQVSSYLRQMMKDSDACRDGGGGDDDSSHDGDHSWLSGEDLQEKSKKGFLQEEHYLEEKHRLFFSVWVTSLGLEYESRTW